MGQVKAPDVPQPKRGLTDFERKIADILFAETGTNELQVEWVLDVAIAIGEGLIKDAIEAEIINWASMFTSIKVIEPERAEAMIKEKFDIGDKVKLIIVKEE